MNELKETVEWFKHKLGQRASGAISEVLKSHSLGILTGLSSDLDALLGDLSEASEVDGLDRSNIKRTLELLLEAVDFAKEDIANS
tara:strand:+ start:235 stop:489 length:255 start_codon:yes stop_codon:yes gene_type:complete